jgi:hypothetical protein
MTDFSKGLPWANKSRSYDIPKAELMDPAKPFVFDMDWKRELAYAKAGLSGYEQQIKDMATYADSMVVETKAQCADATEYAARAAKLRKRLDKERERWVKETGGYTRAVNAMVKPWKEDLERAEKTLGRKIATHTDIQEQARRKAEAEARRATEELNARLAKEAETGGYEAFKIEAPIAETVATKTRTESGSSSVKEEWKWEVSDFAALPDEYKVPNEKMLDQVLKAGKHEIPGLRIYTEKKTTIITR